jgi:hypothetical protein
MTEEEAVELFKRWYVEPIEKLKELPKGAGGWVAFMVALALYERLTKTKLKLKEKPANPDNVRQEMANDLDLSLDDQKTFWDMFRNGLLHGAMPEVGPKAGLTHYWLDSSFSGRPQFIKKDGVPIVCIDPWKFADRVLKAFLSDPKLIMTSNSYPLANIIEQKTEHPMISQEHPSTSTRGAILPQGNLRNYSGGAILPQENLPTNTGGTISPYIVPPKTTDS